MNSKTPDLGVGCFWRWGRKCCGDGVRWRALKIRERNGRPKEKKPAGLFYSGPRQLGWVAAQAGRK